MSFAAAQHFFCYRRHTDSSAIAGTQTCQRRDPLMSTTTSVQGERCHRRRRRVPRLGATHLGPRHAELATDMFRALWICGSAGQSRDDRRATIFEFCEFRKIAIANYFEKRNRGNRAENESRKWSHENLKRRARIAAAEGASREVSTFGVTGCEIGAPIGESLVGYTPIR
jgi:hypothetical protein